MSNKKSDSGDGLEIDIDTLIRENAQAVADYELQESPESQNQDLQDRQALRRVSGLSTELQDVSDAEYRQLRLEKVVLGNTYIQSTAKFKITKEELMQFISNKVERSRISKNNENNYFDYVLNSTAKKENVIFASKCFLTALEK